MCNAQRIVVLLIFSMIIACLNSGLFAQYSNKQIDSLFEVSRLLRKQGEVVKAGLLYERLLAASKRNGYIKGLGESYLRIANLHTFQGNYTTANLYLDSAQACVEKVKDPWSETTLYAERGKNFYFLNLTENALENLNTASIAVHRIADKGRREQIKAYIYEYQSLAFEDINRLDSAFLKVKMAFNTAPTPIMAGRIALFYLKRYKQPDSAWKHLAIARDMIASGRFNVHNKSIVLRIEGIFEAERQEFAKAVQFYQQSIELSKHLGVKAEEMVTNRLLSASYKALNDQGGMAASLERYTQLSDSLSQDQREAAVKTVKKWLVEKEESGKWARIKLYTLIAVVVVVVSAILYVVIRRSRHSLAKKEAELARKDEVIEDGIRKQDVLHQKLNDSFNELVELAKKNDSNFYVRFNEVYPEVQVALLTLIPGLRITELTLCAYIFLNFSTKDIAEYTFTSPRTVQTRKYHLRKKLGLEFSDDIYVWMKKLSARR